MDAIWAIMILTTIVAFLGTEAEGAEFSGYVGAAQTGDALQTVQVGLTVEWKYVEFDLSHGVQKTQWRVPVEPDWEMDEWQSGTEASFRIYPFRTETIRPLFIWTHVSDIVRGKPFNDSADEPTSDYFGIGATVEYKRFELDVTYGTFGRECQIIECASGSRTNEFKVSFRGYFWK
jgi:hypothetical protein